MGRRFYLFYILFRSNAKTNWKQKHTKA